MNALAHVSVPAWIWRDYLLADAVILSVPINDQIHVDIFDVHGTVFVIVAERAYVLVTSDDPVPSRRLISYEDQTRAILAYLDYEQTYTSNDGKVYRWARGEWT